MIYIEDIITVLDLCSGDTSIKGYYNESIGVFPTTIFDGYDINSKANESILKHSIPLIHVTNEYVKDKYGVDYNTLSDIEKNNILKDIALKWCKENNLDIKL